MTNINERRFQEFVKRNKADLLAEYARYGSHPEIDYCVGQPCSHFHNFTSYARNEFAAYTQQIQDDKLFVDTVRQTA